MRRQVPLLITSIVGLFLIFAVFIPPWEGAGETSTVFFDIIAAFAFFLGGGNLVRIHGAKLFERKEGWLFSVVTLVGFFVTLAAGLFKIGNAGGIAAPVDATGSLFDVMYSSIFAPLGATMYSLLAFFVASASYRAFRAKNREATILLIAAVIILLGRTPFGTVLTSWMPESLSMFELPNLAVWIMKSPNLAGQRAILVGIGLGVIAISLRIILGIERGYLGDDRG